MPHTLLLAADSVTIQRVIELTFADEDIQVTSVSDGQEAVRRILADRPDIVLADVNLPGRDGYQVAAFVKDDPSLEAIPVVLLAGAFEPVDARRVEAARCDGVLAKPFDPQVLIARVRELLGRAAPEAGGAGGWAEAASAGGDVARDPDLERFDLGTVDLHAASSPRPEASLDEYFDQLDAAFASLTGGQPAGDTAATDGPPVPVAEPAAGPASVSDAFEALLDAEEKFGPDSVHLAPVAQAAARPSPGVDDMFIDEVARRVAERIGQSGLRQMVRQVVSETAERLIRDEIERLKAAVK
jgi:CheY-like chemotaxis protein